jgi:hypothetical protein
MADQGNLSPETAKRLLTVATAELIIEFALIILLLFVLQWPADITTIAIIIFPALPCGAYILYLVMHDRKKERPV